MEFRLVRPVCLIGQVARKAQEMQISSIDVRLLADVPEALQTLAAWYRAEWQPYYGEGGPGNAVADLNARCNSVSLPLGMVAMKDKSLLGTAALDVDAATNLCPSIVGLLVEEKSRRQGVATALLEHAVDMARNLGYRELYISTAVLDKCLERRGWKKIDDVVFHDGAKGAIYSITL